MLVISNGSLGGRRGQGLAANVTRNCRMPAVGRTPSSARVPLDALSNHATDRTGRSTPSTAKR
jgi:hypothetical protein